MRSGDDAVGAAAPIYKDMCTTVVLAWSGDSSENVQKCTYTG